MEIIDFLLHFDQHLNEFIIQYHHWVYLFLFMIFFVETGLVIMPFLPGDSLLFFVGMLAAQGSLSLGLCILLLILAAILGDACNYFIGKYVGHHILNWKLFGWQLVKPKHLEKTHQFYEQHGPKTIIIARFVPLVRTFAPFVAGVISMKYRTFLMFNIIGGVLWVMVLSLAGYYLGQIEFVHNNFEKVVLLIVALSLLPVVFSFIKSKFSKTVSISE